MRTIRIVIVHRHLLCNHQCVGLSHLQVALKPLLVRRICFRWPVPQPRQSSLKGPAQARRWASSFPEVHAPILCNYIMYSELEGAPCRSSMACMSMCTICLVSAHKQVPQALDVLMPAGTLQPVSNHHFSAIMPNAENVGSHQQQLAENFGETLCLEGSV